MTESSAREKMQAAAQRAAEVLWAPQQSGARGPKPAMPRSAVVTAAVQIANNHGLGAATLRAIAEQLGVSIAGLYRYVAGKNELIALMIEQVRSTAVAGEESRDWRTQLERRALGDWDLYHAHPWLLEVPMGQAPPGPSTVAWFDAGLGAALRAGLRPADAVCVVNAIDHLVAGAARDSLEQRAFARASGVAPMEWWRMHGRTVIEAEMAAGRYPHLARAIADGGFQDQSTDQPGADTFADQFRQALRLLLDGVALRL